MKRSGIIITSTEQLKDKILDMQGQGVSFTNQVNNAMKSGSNQKRP